MLSPQLVSYQTATSHTLLITLALVLLLASAPVKPEPAEKVIRWMSYDFPPYEIVTGPEKNQGIIDRIRIFITAATGDYRHYKPILINKDRMKKLLRSDRYCHASVIPTSEMLKSSYMSYKTGITFPHTLITTEANHLKNFNNRASVSLLELLKNKDLIMAVPSRSMGETLNEIIANHKNQTNVHIRKSFKSRGVFENMLFKSRADYFIDYPTMVVDWNKANPNQKLVALIIKETEDQYITARVSCSRNQWGKQAINRINSALVDVRKDPNYFYSVFLTRTPPELRATLQKEYDNTVLNDRWTNTSDEAQP